MSCNYADELSEYDDKGICGLPECQDSETDVNLKVNELADMIRCSKHFVVHTGAGISTASGIPDFRGPRGVWTLEQQGEKPSASVPFEQAEPSFTHQALVALQKSSHLKFLISQNVDGLHLRSGFPAQCLAELHGNVFLDQCQLCHRFIVRRSSSKSVGQKLTGAPCPLTKSRGQACRGKLRDTILDWEDELPKQDLKASTKHSQEADLSLCLGSTLQINPSGTLPISTKKNGGKFVIVNLQPTKHDSWADLIIHDYVDNVMRKLTKLLGVEVNEYCPEDDPTLQADKCVLEFRRCVSSIKPSPKKRKPKPEPVLLETKKVRAESPMQNSCNEEI